eukprot:13009972-Alexandrium_andersonii.AAC.1
MDASPRQSVRQSGNQTAASQSASQSVSQPVRQSVSQTVSQTVNQADGSGLVTRACFHACTFNQLQPVACDMSSARSQRVRNVGSLCLPGGVR